MPITKTASKHKSSIAIFVFSLIVSLIPLGIIAIISAKNSNVWAFPYSFYVYATIGTMLWFGLYNGLIACKRRRRYTAYKTITYFLLVAVIVLGFIFREATKEVSFHIIVMVLFMYSIYQLTDNSEDKSLILFRYFAPVLTVTLGLIPCLWFVSVGWVGASAIIAFIFGIGFFVVALVSSIIYHAKHLLENAIEDEYEYTEATPEEIAAKGAAKDAAKAGIELSGDENSEWQLGNLTVNYLTRSANEFYNEALEKLKSYISDKEDDLERAKFNYVNNSFTDSEKVYKDALAFYNFYVSCYNHLDKEYKELIHDIKAFTNRHITSKDYGKYIIFDFIKRYDVKSKYHNRNACKVAIKTFEKTYCCKGDFPGVRVAFAEYIQSFFEFDKIH